MRIINTKSSDEDSFKYSILCSLHYYDISCHPERITKLKPFENDTHNTPIEFEIDNPNISLTIFNGDNKIMHFPNNNTSNKAQIVKVNKYRYARIKLSKNYYIKLKELLMHYPHQELGNHLNQILREKVLELKLMHKYY